MAAYGMDPKPGLLFHKTWTDGGIDGVPTLPTRGRKNDPDGLDLVAERRAVADIIAEMKRTERRLTRLARQRRNWRRRRNAIRAAGKKSGIATARKKIRELSRKIKALKG
jgi:hypothetical protein